MNRRSFLRGTVAGLLGCAVPAGLLGGEVGEALHVDVEGFRRLMGVDWGTLPATVVDVFVFRGELLVGRFTKGPPIEPLLAEWIDITPR